jgi:hypothetical protein
MERHAAQYLPEPLHDTRTLPSCREPLGRAAGASPSIVASAAGVEVPLVERDPALLHHARREIPGFVVQEPIVHTPPPLRAAIAVGRPALIFARGEEGVA